MLYEESFNVGRKNNRAATVVSTNHSGTNS